MLWTPPPAHMPVVSSGKYGGEEGIRLVNICLILYGEKRGECPILLAVLKEFFSDHGSYLHSKGVLSRFTDCRFVSFIRNNHILFLYLKAQNVPPRPLHLGLRRRVR